MVFTDRTGNRPSTSRTQTHSVFKLADLDPRIQRHLSKVYATLTCTCALAALGTCVDLYLHVGGLLTQLVGLVSLLGLTVVPASSFSPKARYATLAVFALCQGASLGPLIGLVLATHPEVMLTAVLATATIFACFSAAALVTQRRSYLYLGGWLSSALMAMLVLRLGGVFSVAVARLAFEAELYVGLLVFSGYVVYDTQLIVERAGAGDMDHIKHALELFVDFTALLVRLTLILLRKAGRDNDEEENPRYRRRKAR